MAQHQREEFLRPPRPDDPTSALDREIQRAVENVAAMMGMPVPDTYRFLIMAALKGLEMTLASEKLDSTRARVN